MEKFRATLDQKVLDAWAARLAARRRGVARVMLALAIALAAFFALLLITKLGVFVVLFFATGAALALATFVDRGSLLCPHCERPPLTAFERGPASRADFCPHCYYWLRSPYAAPVPGEN